MKPTYKVPEEIKDNSLSFEKGDGFLQQELYFAGSTLRDVLHLGNEATFLENQPEWNEAVQHIAEFMPTIYKRIDINAPIRTLQIVDEHTRVESMVYCHKLKDFGLDINKILQEQKKSTLFILNGILATLGKFSVNIDKNYASKTADYYRIANAILLLTHAHNAGIQFSGVHPMQTITNSLINNLTNEDEKNTIDFIIDQQNHENGESEKVYNFLETVGGDEYASKMQGNHTQNRYLEVIQALKMAIKNKISIMKK